MKRERVLVLGAGLMGVCTALGLAKKGFGVTLVDAAPDALMRASLRNEGKIHLGLVYANDATLRTSSLMLRGALAFAGAIDELVGPLDWPALHSTPFRYLVMRDSMLPLERLLERYAALERDYHELRADHAYLGTRPERLHRLAPRLPPELDARHVAAAVDTAELSVSLPELCARLRAALASEPAIERLYRHRVLEVARTPAGFAVAGAGWRREGAQVVNCLWDGRLAIDRQLGLEPQRPWVYRLKYRLIGRLPPALTSLGSFTAVLGRYGDVVTFARGPAHFSWYPACLRGWSGAPEPPASWREACAGEPAPELVPELTREALAGLAHIAPGIEGSRIDEVDAGVIFSWGASDIDDPNSELHLRFDVGPRSHEGYHTVDTAKLTTAPLFARELVQALA